MFADDIVIVLGGEVITLRPTLKAALALSQRDGGFPKLAKEIGEGSLTAALDIVRVHSNTPYLAQHILDQGIDTLSPALLLYVAGCTGLETDPVQTQTTPTKASGKPVSFTDYLTGLYKAGTGWLGWSPAETLAATPAEIQLAFTGRVEMLKAIFGGNEPDKPATPFTDENVKSVFSFLKTQKEKP